MADGEERAGLWRHWPRLLLIIPFALVLWVPFYNRIEPTFIGIPFFYWYQLAAILLGAFVVVSVYRLEKRLARQARETTPTDDLPPDDEGQATGGSSL